MMHVLAYTCSDGFMQAAQNAWSLRINIMCSCTTVIEVHGCIIMHMVT